MEDVSGSEVPVKCNCLARFCDMEDYFGYGNELRWKLIDLEIPYPTQLDASHLQ
jgi:hypothetical protein